MTEESILMQKADDYVAGLSEETRAKIAKKMLNVPEHILTDPSWRPTRDQAIATNLWMYAFTGYEDEITDELWGEFANKWEKVRVNEHFTRNAMSALSGKFKREGKEILAFLNMPEFNADDFEYLGNNTYSYMGLIIIQFHQSPAGMEWWPA